MFDILRTLSNKDYKITLAYQKEGDLLVQYKEYGVELTQIRSTHLRKKTSFSAYRKLIKSFRKLKSENYDIAYVNELIDIPLSAHLKKKGKINHLVCHLRLPPPPREILQKRNQISHSIKQVDQFFVGTERMKNLYFDWGIDANKIDIVPNCFDFSQEASTKSENLNTIGYIGRITPEKGIHDLFELLKAIPNLKLLIAGLPQRKEQEAYYESLKRQTIDLPQVKFIGHVADIKTFYQKIDLCLFPSNWEEPFGRVLVESIIHNTPVLGRDVGSVKEILHDNGTRTFKDLNDLIEKVNFFYENPESYQLSNLKKQMESKFELNKVCHQIDTIFQSLVNG